MSNYPWCSLTPRDNISDIETRWLECQFWWRLSFTVNQFLNLKKNTAVLFWPQFPFFTILFLPRRWSVSVMSLMLPLLNCPASLLTRPCRELSVPCFSSRLSPVCASPRLCQAQKCHTREFCVRTMTLSGSSRDTSISLILIQGECESSRMAVFFKLTQHNLRKTLPWCRWQLGQHTRTNGILTAMHSHQSFHSSLNVHLLSLAPPWWHQDNPFGNPGVGLSSVWWLLTLRFYGFTSLCQS